MWCVIDFGTSRVAWLEFRHFVHQVPTSMHTPKVAVYARSRTAADNISVQRGYFQQLQQPSLQRAHNDLAGWGLVLGIRESIVGDDAMMRWDRPITGI